MIDYVGSCLNTFLTPPSHGQNEAMKELKKISSRGIHYSLPSLIKVGMTAVGAGMDVVILPVLGIRDAIKDVIVLDLKAAPFSVGRGLIQGARSVAQAAFVAFSFFASFIPLPYTAWLMYEVAFGHYNVPTKLPAMIVAGFANIIGWHLCIGRVYAMIPNRIDKKEKESADQSFLLGEALAALKLYEDALKAYQKALEIQMALFENENHKDIADCYFQLGDVYATLEKNPEARDSYQKTLQIQRALFKDENHEDIADCYYNIGIALKNLKENEKALDSIKKAFNIYTHISEENKKKIANCYYNIGIIRKSLGKKEKALSSLENAGKIYDEHFKGDQEGIANCYFEIGSVQHALGKNQEAWGSLNKALTIRPELSDKDPETVKECRKIFEAAQAAIQQNENQTDGKDKEQTVADTFSEIQKESNTDTEEEILSKRLGELSEELQRLEESKTVAEKEVREARQKVEDEPVPRQGYFSWFGSSVGITVGSGPAQQYKEKQEALQKVVKAKEKGLRKINEIIAAKNREKNNCEKKLQSIQTSKEVLKTSSESQSAEEFSDYS